MHTSECGRHSDMLFQCPQSRTRHSGPTNPCAHLLAQAHLVILGIRGSLVDDIDRSPTELQPLPLEAQIAQPRLVLGALAPIVLEEQI